MTRLKKSKTKVGLGTDDSKSEKTYYDDYPVSESHVTYEDPDPDGYFPGARVVHVKFDNGTPRGYRAETVLYYPIKGQKRVTTEHEIRNGVAAEIVRAYDEEGNVLKSDTLFNELKPTDIGFRSLQQQFEDEKPWYKQILNALKNRFFTLFKKQGGYLRLQKQGGKLTEVWTPFN